MPAPVRFDWATDDLRRRLDPVLPGIRVEAVAGIGSTSTELVERARRGERLPALLVAEDQTAGRGRAGRQWLSSPGASLTFSLSMPLDAADWSGLSLAVGLALADALDPRAGPGACRIGLKWPNDLMLGRPTDAGPVLPRKLGGILIESVMASGVRVGVIGVGLNIAAQPFPEFGLGHACLHELLPRVDAPQALARVAPALAQAVAGFARDGFAPLVARYAERDLLAGQAVHTSMGDGVADGVDADGALWLKAGGPRQRVTSGEVSSVRWRARSAPGAAQEAAC